MLGILGGMGPAATVDFLDKIVKLTPAERDQEHLPLVVFGVPQVPDRSAAIVGSGADPLPQLLAGIDFLNHAGAGLIAIPCNTAHHWYEELSARSAAPILHIARVTANSIRLGGEGTVRVAVLATRGSLASGFYDRELERRGIACVPLNEGIQEHVDACIREVKAGAMRSAVSSLNSAVALAAGTGATAVITGCTELSVAAQSAGPMILDVFDSALALARAAVQFGLDRGWNRVASERPELV